MRKFVSATALAPLQLAEERSDESAVMAERLWLAASGLPATLGERYLAGRHLPLGGASNSALRFHPRTPFGPRPATVFRPALLAAVVDHDRLVAIQRTFLAPDGTLAQDVEPARRMLGRPGAGAVCLAPATTVLGLAEGVETALSAIALFDTPCWATLGLERFGSIDLPTGLKTLILFVDNDSGGDRAEALARSAYAGRVALEVRRPEPRGADWNDVLRLRKGCGEGEERRRRTG